MWAASQEQHRVCCLWNSGTASICSAVVINITKLGLGGWSVCIECKSVLSFPKYDNRASLAGYVCRGCGPFPQQQHVRLPGGWTSELDWWGPLLPGWLPLIVVLLEAPPCVGLCFTSSTANFCLGLLLSKTVAHNSLLRSHKSLSFLQGQLGVKLQTVR